MTDALETDKQGNSLLRRLVLYLRWPGAIFALAGLALSSWVHIGSLRGIDVESTRPSVWLLHYLLFPIILVVVLEAFSRRYPSATENHIRVPVGEECLLPATVCADEYFSLFSKAAVSRLN